MKIALLVWAALAAVLVAVPAPASPCNTPVCNTPVCNTPVAQTVVATPVITLPLYGAAYTGESDAETRELLKQLLEEMRALRKDLQKPAAPPDTGDGPPVPPLKAVDVFAVIKSQCASCHTGDKAKGEFQLVTDKGEFVRLSPADRREVEKRVRSGAMPPAPKRLTAAERDALLAAIKDKPATIPESKKNG